MLLVVDLPRGSHQACDAALSRGGCNFLCDPCSLRICSAYPDQACRTGSETQLLHSMQVFVPLTSKVCNRHRFGWRWALGRLVKTAGVFFVHTPHPLPGIRRVSLGCMEGAQGRVHVLCVNHECCIRLARRTHALNNVKAIHMGCQMMHAA